MSFCAEELRKSFLEMDQKRDAGLSTPEDIVRFDNIVYGEDPLWNKLDVYYEKGTIEKLPVIVSVHGGGWVYGDKDLYQYYGMHLAQMGFTVVNFSYRLAPENPYPAALEDVNTVFLWIEQHADKYLMDLQNVFVVGDSAGGQISSQYLAILTNPEYNQLFQFNLPQKVKVKAAALNCGEYDIMKYTSPESDGPINQYIDKNDIGKIPSYDVMKYITSAFPPAFIMTSYYDFLKDSARPFYELLKSKGVPCEYHIYGSEEAKNIGHVFHLNIRSEEALLCNKEECAFFRKYVSNHTCGM